MTKWNTEKLREAFLKPVHGTYRIFCPKCLKNIIICKPEIDENGKEVLKLYDCEDCRLREAF